MIFEHIFFSLSIDLAIKSSEFERFVINNNNIREFHVQLRILKQTLNFSKVLK